MNDPLIYGQIPPYFPDFNEDSNNSDPGHLSWLEIRADLSSSLVVTQTMKRVSFLVW